MNAVLNAILTGFISMILLFAIMLLLVFVVKGIEVVNAWDKN